MNKSQRGSLLGGLTLIVLASSAAPAWAADEAYQAELQPVPVNNSGSSGSVMLRVQDNVLSFEINAEGLVPGQVHAVNIHYGQSARGECPTEADNNAPALPGEEDPSAHLTTTEGSQAYGNVLFSFTTEGDTGPGSILAVERYQNGPTLNYNRTDVALDDNTARLIASGEAAVLIHGVDHNQNGVYDAGERGASDLEPSLPGEATDPALCGIITPSQMSQTPNGSVAAGGGTQTAQTPLILGVGIMAMGSLLLVGRRRA